MESRRNVWRATSGVSAMSQSSSEANVVATFSCARSVPFSDGLNPLQRRMESRPVVGWSLRRERWCLNPLQRRMESRLVERVVEVPRFHRLNPLQRRMESQPAGELANREEVWVSQSSSEANGVATVVVVDLGGRMSVSQSSSEANGVATSGGYDGPSLGSVGLNPLQRRMESRLGWGQQALAFLTSQSSSEANGVATGGCALLVVVRWRVSILFRGEWSRDITQIPAGAGGDRLNPLQRRMESRPTRSLFPQCYTSDVSILFRGEWSRDRYSRFIREPGIAVSILFRGEWSRDGCGEAQPLAVKRLNPLQRRMESRQASAKVDHLFLSSQSSSEANGVATPTGAGNTSSAARLNPLQRRMESRLIPGRSRRGIRGSQSSSEANGVATQKG